MLKKEINYNYPYYKYDVSFLDSLFILYDNIFRYKNLIWQLALRDLFSLYRRSVIGLFWLVLTPFIQVVTWILLKKTSILDPGTLTIPYPVYVLIGTMIWALFVSVQNSTMNVFKQSRMVMMRVNIPFEVFFIVQIIVKLIPFFISLSILLPLLLLFNIQISLNILLLPFSLLPILFLSTALGMLSSLLISLSYDLQRLISSLINIMMFFTPVVYSLDKINNGIFKTIVLYNPMSHFLVFTRNLFFNESVNFSNGYLISSFISFGLLLYSWRFLSLTYNRLLERIY